MRQDITLTRQRLTTPRSAAVAGILFSVLLIISLVLIRISVPIEPDEGGSWLDQAWKNVNLALNLVPFAGIAFLWFIGVVRDRLGAYEDRRFFHCIPRQRAAVSGHAVFFCCNFGRFDLNLRNHTSRFDRVWHLYFRPRGNLPDHERVCDQDGRGVHDFYLYIGDPHRDFPALDGISWLRAGAAAAPEHRLNPLDFTGLPAVGAIDQCLYLN